MFFVVVFFKESLTLAVKFTLIKVIINEMRITTISMQKETLFMRIPSEELKTNKN